MDTQQMLMMLPDLQPEELVLIQNITKEMTGGAACVVSGVSALNVLAVCTREVQASSVSRKSAQYMGFIGWNIHYQYTIFFYRLQRFVIGEIGMGLLFLFTFGFCGIGTIIDLIHLDTMCSRYNQKQVLEAANLVKMMQQ